MSSAEVLALPPTKEPAFDRAEAIRALAAVVLKTTKG